jgi:hypothetical protein
MIEVPEAARLIIDTIRHDKRHAHYDRVCKHADFNKRIITGEGLEVDLQQIISRETPEQFLLRKKVFFPLAPAICHRADVPFAKVHRAQGTIERMLWKGEKNEKSLARLTTAMDEFWGDEDLSDYMADRFRELNRMDPNAWIIVEFEPFDAVTATAKPYPLEISSHEAINWSKVKNTPEWVIGMFPSTYQSSTGKAMEGKRFVMYFGDVLEFLQVETDMDASQVFNPRLKVQRITIDKNTYQVTLFQPYAPGQVKKFQGVQPGHLKDPGTNGQTYISYLHHARNRMLDTLKAGSEQSLVFALQAHPQVYMYLPPCPGERTEAGEPPMPCSNGKNLKTGATCTKCNGSGKSIPTSVLEVMVFDLPDNFTEEGVPDLSKLKHTFAPDVEIIKLLREHLKDLEDQCIRDIFTSLQHQRGQVTATATEVNAETEAMNDSLHPYARKVSTARTTIVYVSAAFVDAEVDLEYTHKFPEDFRLAPLGAYLDDLSKARTAQASTAIIEVIEDDVMAKKLRDRPFEMRQFEVKKLFRPLAHLSSQERASALAGTDVAESDRILLIYEKEIYRLLGKDGDFWYKEEEAQKALIDAQVQMILKRVRDERVIEVDFEREVEPEGDGGLPGEKKPAKAA